MTDRPPLIILVEARKSLIIISYGLIPHCLGENLFSRCGNSRGPFVRLLLT